MQWNLLATKLHRPSPPPKRIQRPHLVRQLNEGLAAGRRLTLVSAPAGFGKTTCVSEWLNSLDLPVGWLSLDAADDDPGRFFAYLVAALQGVDEALGREMAGVLQAGQLPPADLLITTLLNDIAQMDRSFILVLDDFHVIRERAILKPLERLIANLPANLHLTLVTREDPPLPLARLRANNQMTEIRAANLRFSSREASDFLNALMELALSEADVATLEDRTEGWIAGLQLAALSMRGRPEPSSFIAGLSGSHHYILSYLTEEVLDQQPEDVRGFLLQTSILDKLNRDICEAVLGDPPEGSRRPDCGALLERLCAANLFLIPLDDDHRWYRYHHLFAQLLANRLRQTLPAGVVQALHCRASDWLAQNGLYDEAINHALAGKDYAGAADLVDHVALEMIFASRISVLRNWLAALPEASFSANPRLGVYGAWIDLLQGRVDLQSQARQGEPDLLKALPRSPENDRVRLELMLALCRYLPLMGNTAAAIRLAQEALESLPESDLAGRARVYFALAVAYSLHVDVENGELAFRECLRLAQAAGDYGLAAEAAALMAQGCYHHGQLREAARVYQSVIDLSVVTGADPFYPGGQGFIGLGSVYLEWDDLEAAERHLERGIELCARGGLDGIYRGYFMRSRLRQARGDLAGALADIDLLDQAFPREDDPLKVGRRFRILAAMGDQAAAARCALPWVRMLDALGHSGDPGASRPPTVILEVIGLLAARALLAQGEKERAVRTLDELLATAEPGERTGLVIEAYLLKALAGPRGKGDAGAALACLERAMALAEPEGYVLLFVEEGPALVPLLQAAAEDGAAPERLRDYARRLLAAIAKHTQAGQPADSAFSAPAGPQSPLSQPAPSAQPAANAASSSAGGAAAGSPSVVIEPLTERELEILRLIGAGCTNQEIAGRLVITLHTVKKHSSNIFGKLGVTSRTQAVARARRLGLITDVVDYTFE